MNSSLSYIIEALKQARRQKKLSQRALSVKVGLPQSHLSKIENGLVDLQASNLIELARVLDRELMLIPRQLIPAIQSLIRQYGPAGADQSLSQALYRLEEDPGDD